MTRNLKRVETHMESLRKALMDLKPAHVGDTPRIAEFISLLGAIEALQGQNTLNRHERELVAANKGINAIKAHRERTGYTLMQSKAVYDSYRRG